MAGEPSQTTTAASTLSPAPEVAHLYLVRHGQTRDNAARRLQGQVDTPLNALGRAQARALAAQFAAELHNADEQDVRVVTSDLVRARDTADAIAQELGVEVDTDPALRERSFGPWERLTHEEIEAQWPSDFQVWRAGHDPQIEGIEGRAACARRIGEALTRHTQQAPEGSSVVVVAHGAAISLGITHLLGLDPAMWAGLRGMDNCHWARLQPNPGRTPAWALTQYNAGAAAPEVVAEDEDIHEEDEVAPGTDTVS